MSSIPKNNNRRKSYTGHIFGMLRVIHDVPDMKGHRRVLVVCECGVEKEVALESLKQGRTISCGCKYKRDVIGQRFGRLKVLEQRKLLGVSVLDCRCDCGSPTTASKSNITRGHTKSCGCLDRDRKSNPLLNSPHMSHGMSRTTEYRIWSRMKDRCLNPNHHAYHRYGGRGIKFSDSWVSFEGFYRDMGDRPSLKHTLDRIDNDKGYSKANCRWASRQAQHSNTSTNRYVMLEGHKLTFSEAARALSVKWRAIEAMAMSGELLEIENTYS